ncbi:Cytochrome P450 monooxygenase trt6 [Lasiodiplodia hormozganensis]|uniref:Cytochrome P450 monooxygenase trt6 n=1 Tax=Lasiodiplodia hormozganensis TaxID=869390 RepID=A0AA39YJC3_9PEZI|nr:Cytochrome P450 monooxygenase trt6 [Lasiodiplodia hormozganensis]
MPGPERDSRPWPLISAPTEIPTHAALAAAAFLALLLLVSAAYHYLQDEKLVRKIEVVGVQPGDTDSKTKQRYAENARSILEEATKKLRRPFQVLTPTGPLIILPTKHVEEIRSEKDFSFHETIAKSSFVRLPGLSLYGGMAGFRFIVEHDAVFIEMVRTHLTRKLSKIMGALSTEATLSLEQNFPPSKDWTPVVFYPTAVHVVARLSARIFLGEEACRDEEWLRITGSYAIDAVHFIRALRNWPIPVRPIVQYLLPERRRLARCEQEARNIIEALIEKRRQQFKDAATPVEFTDGLQWQEDASNRHQEATDVVAGQLALALTAIHTTSSALTRVLFDLCQHPEWVEPLREEVRRVLAEEGGEWRKSTLLKMRLMDSVLKESQRISPVHLTLMTRVAMADVTLPSAPDLHIPKGSMVAVYSSEALRDPVTFPDPERFVGDRFLRLREEEGNRNKWQYVTTSAQHLGFGHGTKSCPGRFFAAAELKVALAHMLLMYDWRFAEGCEGRNIEVAQDIIPDPTAQVCFRRRYEDI